MNIKKPNIGTTDILSKSFFFIIIKSDYVNTGFNVNKKTAKLSYNETKLKLYKIDNLDRNLV